jgi:hypothetical protein
VSENNKLDDEAIGTSAPVVTDMPADGNRGKKRLWWVLASLALVVIIAAATVVWCRYQERQVHQEAVNACSNVSSTAMSTGSGLQETIQDAHETVKDSENQVLDPATVKTLADTLHNIKEDEVTVSCDPGMTVSELDHNREMANEWNVKHRELIVTINQQRSAVIASVSKKALADAQAGLAQKNDEARSLLAESEGKVVDNSARERLQKVIEQVGEVGSTQVGDYRKAVDSLNDAMEAVRESMSISASDFSHR